MPSSNPLSPNLPRSEDHAPAPAPSRYPIWLLVVDGVLFLAFILLLTLAFLLWVMPQL